MKEDKMRKILRNKIKKKRTFKEEDNVGFIFIFI